MSAPRVLAPSSGDVIVAHKTRGDVYINTGTLAELTVVMPSAPAGGEMQALYFKGAITSLTVVNGKGQAIDTAPVEATAESTLVFWFVNASIGWVLRG